jgi:phospholipid/cholesterol/gamma-HCH transport system substrate-binding protein
MIVDIGILFENINTLTREFEENPSDLLFKSRKQRRAPGE